MIVVLSDDQLQEIEDALTVALLGYWNGDWKDDAGAQEVSRALNVVKLTRAAMAA